MGNAGRLLALLVIAAVIAWFRPAFLNPENLINVLRQASLMILQAAGLTWAIISGGIDLSVGATLAMAATGGGFLLMKGLPIPVVIVTIVAAGALVGLINGTLTAYVKLPPFIATYGMLWIIQGTANLIMQGEIFFGFPKSFLFLGAGHVAGIPVPVLVTGLVIGLMIFVQTSTVFGRELYATGSNDVAATLAGVPVRRVQVGTYVVSGLTAAIAGLIFIARMDAAEASVGDPTLLPALCAVVIGGTSMSGGKGGVGGTVLGAIIMTVILNGMNLMGIQSLWQPLVVGTVIITAVGLDLLAQATAHKEMATGDSGNKSEVKPKVA